MATKVPAWFVETIRTGKFNKNIPGEVTIGSTGQLSETPEVDLTPMDNTPLMDHSLAPRTNRGASPSKVVSWSYYNTPIVDRPLKGNSRRWGDASPEVKETVQGKLIEEALSAGLTKRETAYVLAIAHIESGFNPDAAAGTTSAHGIGQFINKTGSAYKISNDNRWDVDTQVAALVQHFLDNKKLLKGDQGEEYIYAYHHDGPSLKYGGLDLSRKRVMPLIDQYYASLQGSDGLEVATVEEKEEQTRKAEQKKTSSS